MRRLLFALSASVVLSADAGYVPSNGFVPDAATATRIAEAVFIPVYGAGQIAKEEPFTARLEGGAWIVKGTLRAGFVGGVAVVKIDRRDGRILYMMHGK